MDVQEEPAFLMPNENRAQNMIENKIKQAQGKYHMYYVKQKVFYLKKQNFCVFLKSWSIKVHIHDRIILTSYLPGKLKVKSVVSMGFNFTTRVLTTTATAIMAAKGLVVTIILDCRWFI